MLIYILRLARFSSGRRIGVRKHLGRFNGARGNEGDGEGEGINTYTSGKLRGFPRICSNDRTLLNMC